MHPKRIEVKQLEYSHPGTDWRLSVPGFEVLAGEFRAILGPNGSGKSTFLRLVSGFLKPQAGSVRINDIPLHQLQRRDIARLMAYLPTETNSEFDYLAEQIVAMGRYAYLALGGFLSTHDRDIIRSAMEITDTLPLSGRKISCLSNGERQRVFLASVLAQEPSVILLDEPANGLDIHHQIKLFRIMSNLTRQGKTVLMVLHDINMASLYCDQISLFHNGRVLATGTPKETVCPRYLSEIYGDDILFVDHPSTGRPMIFPKGSEFTV